MPLTVGLSALKTVTQVAERRLVEVAVFGDKVVDVAVATTQDCNFTDTYVC